MTKNGTNRGIDDNALLLKGSQVLRLLNLGRTSGYRFLKKLEDEKIMLPVVLPGLRPRWKREDVEQLIKTNNAT